VVGLYGVITYSVRQRRREIGVRIALGAQRNAIYALVLGQAGWLIGIGLAFGLSWTRWARRACCQPALLRECVGSRNAKWRQLMLAVASFAAVFLPAQRAASVDPAEVLRTE
jgi:ABC-type antimicrobial peptide transport system permease subunit